MLSWSTTCVQAAPWVAIPTPTNVAFAALDASTVMCVKLKLSLPLARKLSGYICLSFSLQSSQSTSCGVDECVACEAGYTFVPNTNSVYGECVLEELGA